MEKGETMRVERNRSVAVVVDVQQRLFPHIYDNERLGANLVTLINGLKVLGIPILLTQQYTKGLGGTIREVDRVLGDYSVIEKISFSCCDESAFDKALENYKKDMVIISGIEAHVCVLQTVVDLIERNITPIVVEDCISSRKENDKRIAVMRMERQGALVTTCESILFELCRFAGNDTFRAISKLVK
jgi:nicotinamidase-related amidase